VSESWDTASGTKDADSRIADERLVSTGDW
jgi:hypothetical protein